MFVCVCPFFLQIRCLKGKKPFPGPHTFDGIHIVNHLIGDDESLHSSDEDFISNHVQESGVHFHLHRRTGPMDLTPAAANSSDSDTENTETPDTIVQKENNQKRVESYSTTV